MCSSFDEAKVSIVSFAAVIRVVTQCSSPTNLVGEERYVTTRITAAKETKVSTGR